MEPVNHTFDVIIIGGSYAGLSAGMALGRSLRNVLIIDSGKPCNWQTPHSHNFITQDGKAPAGIAALAKAQVMEYPTVKFLNGLVADIIKKDAAFQVTTQSSALFLGKKILFATGLSDEMPEIEGFAECWGISVLHCPYCHGYEVRGETIGIIGNGESGFELCRLISHWSKKLTLLTNGRSTLTAEQVVKLKEKKIGIEERQIRRINHTEGKLTSVMFDDHSEFHATALYARPRFTQRCDIPERMGCELTDQGFIKINDFLQTTIPGTYAAGDNTTGLRSVATQWQRETEQEHLSIKNSSMRNFESYLRSFRPFRISGFEKGRPQRPHLPMLTIDSKRFDRSIVCTRYRVCNVFSVVMITTDRSVHARAE